MEIKKRFLRSVEIQYTFRISSKAIEKKSRNEKQRKCLKSFFPNHSWKKLSEKFRKGSTKLKEKLLKKTHLIVQMDRLLEKFLVKNPVSKL